MCRCAFRESLVAASLTSASIRSFPGIPFTISHLREDWMSIGAYCDCNCWLWSPQKERRTNPVSLFFPISMIDIYKKIQYTCEAVTRHVASTTMHTCWQHSSLMPKTKSPRLTANPWRKSAPFKNLMTIKLNLVSSADPSHNLVFGRLVTFQSSGFTNRQCVRFCSADVDHRQKDPWSLFPS